jgi:hypothetical protein
MQTGLAADFVFPITRSPDDPITRFHEETWLK